MTARGSVTRAETEIIKTLTETKIEIETETVIEIVIEIETQEECVLRSDRNVIPINQTAAKVDAPLQLSNVTVKKMVGCVLIKEEKITSAARINVVMMGSARVLPQENPVLWAVTSVVEGYRVMKANAYNDLQPNQPISQLPCLHHSRRRNQLVCLHHCQLQNQLSNNADGLVKIATGMDSMNFAARVCVEKTRHVRINVIVLEKFALEFMTFVARVSVVTMDTV